MFSFRNDSSARVNYCDQQLVTQHDLLRELAIHLNSKLPLEKRTRLIINIRGDEFPTSIKQVQEPMQARILSISTGFYSFINLNGNYGSPLMLLLYLLPVGSFFSLVTCQRNINGYLISNTKDRKYVGFILVPRRAKCKK